MLRAVIWHLCLKIQGIVKNFMRLNYLYHVSNFLNILSFLNFTLYFFIDFQEKIGEDKNKNSSHDFKTLADVLIQESIRYDMGKEFPELKDSIQAKL